MPANSRFDKVNQELMRRDTEALKVYRPYANQSPFHASRANERIIRGGKRSGKSIAAAMEFGSIVTGQPIIGMDGKPIAQARPYPTSDYPRIYWIIGWGVSHIGQTIHKLLFQEGMGGTFRVVRDPNTNQWRTWDRTRQWDADNVRKSRLAGPIIPERFIVPGSWVWNSSGGGAAGNCFESVELTTGAKIFAYPSSARTPKQGDAVSGIWIDEDIQNPDHLSEYQDRLGDETGWFNWSVWPHTKNFALIDMLDRAERELESEPEERQIESFQLVFSENPFITSEGKKAQLSRMGDAESIARRDRGELLLDQLAMYDYTQAIHTIDRTPVEWKAKPENAYHAIRQWYARYGLFPDEWTRYLAVDPSNTRTACLSFVVPPPEFFGVAIGNLAIVEWELVRKKASAKMLANDLLPLMSRRRYEAFVMDRNMGRQTRIGDDQTVFDAYAKEFKAAGLASRQTLSGFAPGCNVPPTRYRAVRDALSITPAGIPQLLLVRETTPETQREFNTYRKKQLLIAGELTLMDEPANPRIHDCMSALEYGITHIAMLFTTGQAYVPSTIYQGFGSGAYKAAMALRKKMEKNERQSVHLGPGAGPQIFNAA